MTPPETPPSDALAALRAALGGQYTIERLLGQGGMGSVFLARDVTLDRPVAIKVINPEVASSTTLRDRFLQEARTVAKLRHPNIVPVFAAGETGGMLYFVMEYVPGESLRDVLTREGRVTGERAERWLREIALALHHAHAQGMVHRDVKPENILIDAESSRAMLTDFGVARAFEKEGGLTQTGMILGSPRYMSPEQASGDKAIDGRSDLYSLALTGYELYAGAPVIQSGTAAAMLVKHLTETPAPLSEKSGEVPAPVAAAVDRGLAKDPDARWQTGREFAEAIAGHALTPTGEVRGAARPSAKSAQQRRMVRVAVITAAATAAAVTAWRFSAGETGTAYLVTPFEIQSGDQSVTWLREASVNMLTLTLGQWSDLHVVDYERTLSLLDKEGLGNQNRLSLDNALAVARRAHAGTVVTGQIQTINDSLYAIAKLYDVRSGKSRNQATEAIALRDDPRPMFDRLAQQLLQIAGGRTSGVELTKATTNSMEAYRAYLEGVKHLNSWRMAEADEAFGRAIALDSTFALAYHKKSLGLGWGEISQRNNPADKAFELRGRLPPREQSFVVGHYHLVHALASGTAGDTAAARVSYAASVKAYDDLFARGDTLVAEAWYGQADAYTHRRNNNMPFPVLNDYSTRALRGFNRTLQIDSTFHLAYAHLVEFYNAAAANGMVVSGDSVFVADSGVHVRLGRDGVQRLRDSARARGIVIAKAWTRSDHESARPFLQLATSYVQANMYDSAVATLTDALARPRSGAAGARVGLLNVQLAYGDTGAATTLDYILDRFTRDSMRAVSVGQRIAAEGDLMAAAAAVGSRARLDKAGQLFASADPMMPGTNRSSAQVIELYSLALRVAMGEPVTPDMRRMLQASVRAIDTASGPFGNQARSGSLSIPYVAFLASHDTSFRSAVSRWTGVTTYTELDALLALDRGDTAAAMQIAKTFTRPDSLRNAQFSIGGMRAMARAEVLAKLGLTRQAAETYEAVKLGTRVLRAGLAEPGYTIWARAILARARLWKQLDEREKAVAAYEEFIRRWKDADGIAAQQVADARRELAEMRDAAKAR
ncbi:MAG TPA: serine/threonine-protein kinase [Gemmatimonadaceae bacterium]|nr:serine/threonine-protein kinase [Gemmatimonadaceae bacterium]